MLHASQLAKAVALKEQIDSCREALSKLPTPEAVAEMQRASLADDENDLPFVTIGIPVKEEFDCGAGHTHVRYGTIHIPMDVEDVELFIGKAKGHMTRKLAEFEAQLQGLGVVTGLH